MVVARMAVRFIHQRFLIELFSLMSEVMVVPNSQFTQMQKTSLIFNM